MSIDSQSWYQLCPILIRLQVSEGQKGLYAYRLEWVTPPVDETRAADLSTSHTQVSGG